MIERLDYRQQAVRRPAVAGPERDRQLSRNRSRYTGIEGLVAVEHWQEAVCVDEHGQDRAAVALVANLVQQRCLADSPLSIQQNQLVARL